MKGTHKVSLVLGLGGMMVAGFSFGYLFHMSTSLEKFAKETDRTSRDYDWTYTWKRFPGEKVSRLVVLVSPDPEVGSSKAGWYKWHWYPSNPYEPCDPDAHRLVWRYGLDRWELVDDLEEDVSVPPYPEPEE